MKNCLRIYIPIWLYLLSKVAAVNGDQQADLHSNMVIFIILIQRKQKIKFHKFTFQYGYIYYGFTYRHNRRVIVIYIPIWLYLLFFQVAIYRLSLLHLHSNMVIFIIPCVPYSPDAIYRFTFQYGYIYYSSYVVVW